MTKKYTLGELLKDCTTGHLSTEENVWLNAEPMGLEITPIILHTPDLFLKELGDRIAPEQPLEIADLGNLIGLLLGRSVLNKVRLQQEFQTGFQHGIYLAKREDEEHGLD